ncbi:DUF7342 family protein [Natronorubrum bangense]|uniref:Sugar-specific transcriptional regulator TrmB n=2 Tax=Natronorubrum bangense TaxID=61858 RepID=A0A4D6HU96_9EURY|nr:hypothetical protein [Natronorubrum bangense]QCC56457.1 hypothetical protein DV706_18210 [Natronorubrum bangense]
MDLTDTPDDIRDPTESPPDFTEWDSPEEVLKGGPTRERLLSVILQLRTPTKVSRIAEQADCDTETARDYLGWFTSMGMTREISGRPVRYERNESYLQWRRVEQIREQYSETEIVKELKETMKQLEEYRAQFDADSPEDVSLMDSTEEASVEEVWEALSEWKTLKHRAELLDTARQNGNLSSGGAKVDV